ncbi:MAG: hypothetical protein JST83_03235 [Bacteroidetes bacterium]|nr:hypothetical protein [Bacteroidota bacterium]
MRKLLSFSLSALLLVGIASCSHTNTNTNAQNGWTYTTENYTVVSTTRVGQTVSYTSSVSPGVLSLRFYNSIPLTSGTFIAVNGTPAAANQVQLTMAPGSVTFYSTGVHQDPITVSVASGSGKVSASFSHLMIAVSPSFSDSTFISGSVTEL